MIGTTELLLVLGIVIVVFGAQKLPQLGSGIGRAIRNFKDEMKGQGEDNTLPPSSDEVPEKLSSGNSKRK